MNSKGTISTPRIFVVLLLAVFFPFMQLTAQEKFITITGAVIDSTTRAPIPQVNVFVPNSTISAMTDEKGKFTLRNIPEATTQLVFSHVNHNLIMVRIGNAVKKAGNITVVMSTRVFEVKEVAIVGRKMTRMQKADRDYFLDVFYTFFLGDPKNSQCKIKNPDVLRFRKDGSRVMATARYPLNICNRQLGYNVTYYLNNFTFHDSKDYSPTSMNLSFYSFEGVALYEEMKPDSKEEQDQWFSNRGKAYSGSLGNFLSCLYKNELRENGYTVLKSGIPEKRKVVMAVSNQEPKRKKLPDMLIDSVFYFDQTQALQKYIRYTPENIYALFERTKLNNKTSARSLQFTDTLLVFSNKTDSLYLWDDEKTLFVIGKGELEFYPNGSYQIYNSDLFWGSLDNKKKINRLLPLDYQPTAKIGN